MKYVLAVSGGVDSMVLLDMMARLNKHELIVAHFDHGIRPDSYLDAIFVQQAAANYGFNFETKREHLGENASEALARSRRYEFLRNVAKKHNAKIVTAHHLDDLVETVAINLKRGTGWRGLAVLDSGIARPLIDIEKSKLLNYANRHSINWREDPTNATDAYLRNRIRLETHLLPESAKKELRSLQAHQKTIKKKIATEVKQLVGKGPWYSRYFFTHLPTPAAYECLRYITKGKLTRPQLARLLHAIKVIKPNSTFEAGNGIRFYFSTRQFRL